MWKWSESPVSVSINMILLGHRLIWLLSLDKGLQTWNIHDLAFYRKHLPTPVIVISWGSWGGGCWVKCGAGVIVTPLGLLPWKALWDQDIWKETQKVGSSQLDEKSDCKIIQVVRNSESKSLKLGVSLACSGVRRGSGWLAKADMRNGYKAGKARSYRQVSLLRKLKPRGVGKPLLSEMGPELPTLRKFCEDILYLPGRPPISCLIFIYVRLSEKPVLLHQFL